MSVGKSIECHKEARKRIRKATEVLVQTSYFGRLRIHKTTAYELLEENPEAYLIDWEDGTVAIESESY